MRVETLKHAVDLFQRTVSELVLNGYSVNTGLFRAVPQFRGVIDGGVWNPERNSIYVSFNQDKDLREAIARTGVKILEPKAIRPISSVVKTPPPVLRTVVRLQDVTIAYKARTSK